MAFSMQHFPLVCFLLVHCHLVLCACNAVSNCSSFAGEMGQEVAIFEEDVKRLRAEVAHVSLSQLLYVRPSLL